MAKKKKDAGLDPIVQAGKERYKIATEGWQHIYDEASDDLKFVYDVDEGQWPSAIRTAREKDGRPIITVNKLQKFVRQLRGDLQMNRPRIKVIPVDNAADPQMAELYNGLIRQIEYLSTANVAYDTAYMHAISSSIGFFRLVTKYIDDNSFDQDIFIKRVLNPLAVHLDPSAIEFTFEDGKYAFVEELVDKEEFKRAYPKATETDFDGHKRLFGDWLYGDKVRVVEYFYKKPIQKKIVLLQTGEVLELSDIITIEEIKARGGEITRERTVDAHEIKWCRMNGVEVLMEADWPGKYIPIIPVLGDEVVVDGKKYYLSLARGAKGPQEMYNYWATSATETVALAPKNPFMVDHRQIKGFENEWEEANRTNRMYIRYNAVAGLQKPAREPQTQIPSAIMAMMQTTAFDIEDHLGRYEASKGQASNERSGKAIMARIGQSDKGTFTFVDNMSRAIVFGGKQIIDLIPKIYDTKRALQIMGDDGTPKQVTVNEPVPGPNGVQMQNDLSVGKYDIIATVGASFGSKRQEMVQMMAESMQYAPTLAPVIAPLIFKYADFPGAQEVYQEIKNAVEKMKEEEANKQK